MALTKVTSHFITGTITNSTTGNAATVTNGIYMNESHSNPSWITGLAWSKITGAPAFITGITSSNVTTALGFTPVTNARQITINGTSFDLSADRSWTITSMIYPSAGIPISTGSGWGSSITNNSTNWNTAYGWGDHGAAGYITSFTETNLFLGDGGSASTHPGSSKLIYSGQVSAGTSALGMPTTNNANAFINLNKHPGEYNSQLGFSSNGNIYYRNFNNSAINSSSTWYKVYTEAVFNDNSANWNTAYGWGNHASAGYLTSHQSLSGYLPLSGGTLSGSLTGVSTATPVMSLQNTTASAYSEIHIKNNQDDRLTIGSIGSSYSNASWAGSRYIYSSSGQFRIKSANELKFYSGGLGDTGDLALFLDTNRNSMFMNAVLIGGYMGSNAYNAVASTTGLSFGGGNDFTNYSIGTTSENFGGNYTKLNIKWHTGIRFFAMQSYGGVRFYSNVGLSTKLFSIGEGDAHVRVSNNLYIGGTVHSTVAQNSWGLLTQSSGTGNESGIWFTGTTARLLLRDSSGAIKSSISANGSAADNIINGNAIIHAGNYSSYALPVSGGTISGALNVTYNGGITGSSAPSYSNANVELITSANHAPAIGFHRGGYSASTLYEYDGQLYINAWVSRAQNGLILSSGNYGSYALPLSGGTMSGSITTTHQNGFRIDSGSAAYLTLDSGNSWSYIQYLYNGANKWDVGSYQGGRYEIRPNGGSGNRFMYYHDGHVQLEASGAYIMGGTITSRQGARFIDVGYSGSCYIEANRTGSGNSTVIIGAATNGTGIWSRVGTTNGGATHSSSPRQFTITMGSTVEFTMATNGVMSGDFNDTSDVLFKKNIENHSYGLAAVNTLKPREFNWKRNTRPQGKQVGFIAQEVEEIIPEVVHGYDGAKSINGTGLISVLTKAIQELSQQVTALKAEVELLKQ